MELLGRCYEFLLQLTLDRRARRVFEQVSVGIAEQIYQGYWFDLRPNQCLLLLNLSPAWLLGILPLRCTGKYRIPLRWRCGALTLFGGDLLNGSNW